MRICLAVLLLLASILMAVALAPLTHSSKATAQVQNPLAQKADEMFARLITKAESEGPVRVIVGLNTAFQPEGFLFNAQLKKSQRDEIAQAQDSMIAQLSSFNARSITRFTFIPFMAMELDAAGLKFLQNSPEVSSIEEDLPIPLTLAESVPLIGANTAWASGFSGAGQTVAILDTGVDKTHSFLAGKVVSEACYSTTGSGFTSVCPGGAPESTSSGSGVNCSFTGCDHGTHVAGIAAGKGTSFSGVAKDANIISIQVFSRPNPGVNLGLPGAFTANMISGLQRVQQLSGSFSIAAVNMSIGGGGFTSNCDDFSPAMKAAIDTLRSVGVATVISSGNGDGTNGFTNAISFPGCISTAISVGSTDDGSGGTTVNGVSGFSNSASFLNLLAPGNPIFSSVPGGLFGNKSGTSMAAPHVAGSWAILKSKAPSATVNQVLQALTSTGLPITDPRNGITKPRIRVGLALNAVPHVLTVSSTNPGTGVNITVGPNDINNLGSGVTQFSRTYNQNTNVTLMAPATAGGNNFQKWLRNGSDWSTNQSTDVAMNADITMTAVYVTPPTPTQTLTVVSSNPASGVSISVSPTDNSNLGNGVTQFTRTYNQNTNVTLIAPATSGVNNFQKWQRNGSDWTTNQSTDVTLDADTTMTAVYVTPPPPTQTLTVASSNPASGVSISVSPTDNSNLGNGVTQFTRTYNQNTSVTLIAPAAAGGNNFQKWLRNGSDLTTNQSIDVTMDADVTMTAVYVTPTRTLTVASSNPATGVNISVSPTDNSNLGNGTTQFSRTYNINTPVTLVAPPTAGVNNFQKWLRNGSDWTTNQSTDVTLDADTTMTAVYVTPTRTLTVASSNPATGVNISVSPADNSNLGNGTTQFTRTYNINTTVTLVAPATAGGNNFQKWLRNGSDWSTNQSIDVTMDADTTMTAVYVTPTRTLTVASSNPASGVNISVSPADNSNLGNGSTQFSRTYNINTTVSLIAPATAGGNNFQKWLRNGSDWSTNQSIDVTMDADTTMTAVYVTPTRTLTVASSNPASGVSITVSPNDNSNQGSGATQFTRTYNQNANVNLTAPATAGGNNFQKWQRDGADWTTSQSTTVTMDVNHTMTAVYVTPTRTLIVSSVVPNSGVSITVSPNDNSNQGNGSTQFTRTYNINTTVTLIAPATAGGNSFQRWERNGSTWSNSPSTTVTMNANQTMTAVYGTRTLTISSSNPNSGVSITVSPNDNNNQSNGTTGFSRTYNLNTTVSLTAPQTAGGNVFQKWQRNGLDWSNSRSTSVTVDNNYSLVAVYVSPPALTQTLTVTAGNPPAGGPINGLSVTVSPNDNNNLGNGATQFSRTYSHGTIVTLTAAPRSGSLFFRGWQRNGIFWTFDRTASLTMDSNYTVMALYGVAANLRVLTVASSNPNSGVSISATPDLNNLGNGTTQFSRTYNSSANATLTAPATAGGSTFQKWQRNGVDWSTNPSTSVTMDVNYTMTAVYGTPSLPTRTLTLASSNPNSGVTITVSPNDNSNQGAGTSQFTRTFNQNTNVILTTPPMVGDTTFQKWQRNGVDWSFNTMTSVLLDADYTMTAVYVNSGSASLFATTANHSIVDWIRLWLIRS